MKTQAKSFELNGVTYVQIEKEAPKNSHYKASRLMMLAQMLSASVYDIGGNSYSRQLPENINIIKEYGLIQNKKSKLSRWEREAVVIIFERNFKPITHE